jgi:hypothetical protein
MMSVDFLKMVGVSLSSSICTAVFVVACTAGAEKMGDDDRGSSDEVAEDDGDGGGGEGDDDGGSDGPGDGDGDDAVSAAEIAELAGQIEDLVAFQVSALCFIGHMTDDQHWSGGNTSDSYYPGIWSDIEWYDHDDGERDWGQGPNSDSQKAYDDCF